MLILSVRIGCRYLEHDSLSGRSSLGLVMSIFYAENVSAVFVVLGHPNQSGRSSHVVVGSANMISTGRGITLLSLSYRL